MTSLQKFNLSNISFSGLSFNFLSLFFLFIILSSIVVSYIVSLRPLSFGPDTHEYHFFFFSLLNEIPLRINDIGFIYLVNFSIFLSEDYRVFFFIIAFMSILPKLFILKKFNELSKFNNIKFISLSLFVFSLYFYSPFFFSGITNIVRHYISVPLLLLSFFYFNKNKFTSMMLMLMACSLHVTNLAFIPLLLIFRMPNNKILIAYIICIVGYGSGFFMFLISYLSSFFIPGIVSALTSSPDYQSGIRLEFLFFNLFVFLISYFIKPISVRYFIQSIYIVLSVPFLLFGFIDFSDRLLVPVFFIVPIVVGYFICSMKIIPIYRLFFSLASFVFSLFFLISKFDYI
ncbi:MAG: EpsG family protein [Paraglaciecola sp.]|nr:EpsG family protein [Paraglaciecola sp.]